MTCTVISSQARAWECGTGSSCFQHREARASLAGSQAGAWEPVIYHYTGVKHHALLTHHDSG
jgi:hypothetical protein